MSQTKPDRIAPDGVDLEHPNVARVYDYYLGGTANYAIDRVFAEKALEQFPFVRPAAMANRLFLHRVVRYLVKQGVRQFIDIGSGVPTMGSTHQVADAVVDDANCVYIDNEPVAVAHSHMLLERDEVNDRHAVIQADLRQPDLLWSQIADTGVIDLEQPVALLLIAVLHVTQPGPCGEDVSHQSVQRFRELLPSGSYLVITHGTADGVPESREEEMAAFGKMYDKSATPVRWRSHAEIEEFFGDLPLVEPGATWTPLWHPEESGAGAPEIEFDNPNDSVVWAGVAHKP